MNNSKNKRNALMQVEAALSALSQANEELAAIPRESMRDDDVLLFIKRAKEACYDATALIARDLNDSLRLRGLDEER